MRNRKMVLVVFLLIAVFCIGSGFALVSDVLDIQGTANVSPANAELAFDQHIYFTSAVANMTGDTASIPAGNNDKATFSVNSLTGKSSKATFTFTIKNDGDLTATITPRLVDNKNTEYFKISSDWNQQAKELAGGNETTYTLTVEMLKTPTDLQTTSFTIELLATAGE